MKKFTVKQLKELDGQEIKDIKAYEDEEEEDKGIITINGANIFNCFSNTVSISGNFAYLNFYDKNHNIVAVISVCDINNECLVIKYQDNIYSETELRVLNMR